jgi:hypothetical protein
VINIGLRLMDRLAGRLIIGVLIFGRIVL